MVRARAFIRGCADLIGVVIRGRDRAGSPGYAYTIRYSARRRHPAVVVHPDLRVEVVAPFGTPRSAIDDLYRRKSSWVERTLQRFRDQPCHAPERQYVPGERFLLAGQVRLLALEDGDGPSAWFEREHLRVRAPAGTVRDEVQGCVVELYRRAALEAIGPLVERHAARIGVSTPPFRVKHLRRRWGSCSRNGRLNFNLRLAMAPPDQLEYIVVHELCHLLHLDHSPAFWRTVARYQPDFEARRAALRRDGWQYAL